MARSRRQKKEQFKRIALQRVHRLFELAEAAALEHKLDRADRYVYLARRLCMRYVVPMPVEYKRRFCKHCYRYMLPGVTCRVRISRNRYITQCLHCNQYMRLPLNTNI